jgi:hypothetical protein
MVSFKGGGTGGRIVELNQIGSPELAHFEIVLEALRPARFTRFPSEGLAAWLYDRVEAVDARRAKRLHDARPKPFSVSPIYDQHGLPVSRVRTGEQLSARVAVLTQDTFRLVSAALEAGIDNRLANSAPPIVQLGQAPLRWVSVVVHGQTTYAALLTSAPLGHLQLLFRSPVVFRHGDQSIIQEIGDGLAGFREAVGAGKPYWQPKPHQALEHVLRERVFSSYLDRWQAFSPIPFQAVSQETLAEQALLTHSQLSTVSLPFKGRPEAGLTGWARYTVAGSLLARAEITALARLATYCGTGARTGLGRGETWLAREGKEGR